MSWDGLSESACNIARSLTVVGDRWTLLLMREIGMGVRRFEELQAQTGMSSHLLSTRLRKLEEDGIIERRVYSARPLRHEYFATPKGKDLDGVLLALRNWNLRWGGNDGKGGASAKITHRKTGELVGPSWNAPAGELFCFDDCDLVIGKVWKVERETNAASFYAAKQNAAPRRRAKRTAPTKSRTVKRTAKQG